MADSKHLLTLWNPSYSADAMDEHLRVLLHWAAEAAAGRAGEDDVYVWWAKLRSPNRQQPLPHADAILALQGQIDAGVETHLYLSDYRSLYVGLVEEVTADSILEKADGEQAYMPGYYEGKYADFWFRLPDIRRVVSDDTPGVIEELKRLRNTRYHDRPVSLYGGMVELPLIVTRDDEVSWFGDREALLDGRLWAERDAELRSQTASMAKDLRDNLLGEFVWSHVEPGTRTFLASAEAVFRTRRDDPNFDFSGPAVEYAKAVEIELNALIFPPLRRLLAKAKPADREVRVDGRPLDLGRRVRHQSLGAIKTLLERDDVVRKQLQVAYASGYQWILGTLPHLIEPLVAVRNPAAHSEVVGREAAGELRESVLGIGREGLLVELVRMKLRAARV